MPPQVPICQFTLSPYMLPKDDALPQLHQLRCLNSLPPEAMPLMVHSDQTDRSDNTDRDTDPDKRAAGVLRCCLFRAKPTGLFQYPAEQVPFPLFRRDNPYPVSAARKMHECRSCHQLRIIP